MNKARIESFYNQFRQIMLSLKNLTIKAISAKPKAIGLAAAFLVLVLTLVAVLTTCNKKEPINEISDTTIETQAQDMEPTTGPIESEPQSLGIPATMGTITTDNLSICKDPGVVVDVDLYYAIDDRVEIHETRNVNGMNWGFTGTGWVDMKWVRMDDVPPHGNHSKNSDGVEIVSNGSHAVLGYGVVDIGTLNVRVGPGTDYTKIKEISQGVRYAYYEVADEWVRIGDGWVSTLYFYVEGTTAEDSGNAIVTTNNLNIRSGPDTSFKRIGSYMKDEAIPLLAEVNGWGYTEKGWISMIYVDFPDPVYTTGNATVTIGLNIREEPDAASAKLDTYTEGDQISIIEVKDGWGKTDKGWINLNYVKYD